MKKSHNDEKVTLMEVNTNTKKIHGFVLLVAGIATGALAQAVLLFSGWDRSEHLNAGNWWENVLNDTFPWPGLFLYVLAGVLIILGIRASGDRLPAFEVNTDGISVPRPDPGFLLISLAVAVAIAMHAAYATGNDPYGYFFAVAWLLSIILLVYSVLSAEDRQRLSLRAVQAWLKAHRAELFVIATIMMAAFLIRLLDVELHPYSFINDEGHMGSGGDCILQGRCRNFFVLGWAAQPRPAFLPYAISIGLLGRTALAVRLVSVFIGTLSVLAVYLFAAEVFNRKVAWLSALLLAALPVHVHFSRTGVDNIVDSLTAPLVLWLLLRGAKRGSTFSFLAAGIVAGLCMYTYPGSLLAPILGVGALGYLALHTHGFLQAHYRNILIFILAASVVVIPILGHYYTHSDLFMARMKKENILQNGRLQYDAQVKEKSAAEILARQLARSSLVFIATDAPRSFFNSPSAYLPPFEAMIFMFGLAYTLWRIKDPRYIVLFAWFWAPVILGSTLTANPPSSQRMLMSMPAVVMMVAIGITKILQVFERFRPAAGKVVPGVLLAFILFTGYTNINFYFYDYRSGHYYEETINELSYETRIYTMPLDARGRLFLLADSPSPHLGSKSFEYFAPNMERVFVDAITFESLLKMPYDREALFLALPDHKADIELLAQLIPGGEWHEVKRRYQPHQTLFYTYKISRERLAVFTSFAGGYLMLSP
jgi:hypothetical protein